MIADASALLPPFELLVRLLHDDDRGIHQRAHGNRDAAERHDVRGDARHPERHERGERGERNGDDRNHRAGHVPQEQENHGGDRDHDLDERPGDIVDRLPNQVGAVVDRHDLHAVGQSCLDLAQLRLHAADHVQRVLALAHDDDARHGFAGAVEIRDAAPHLGAEHDVGDVLDADWRPPAARTERDVLEIGGRARVPQAAHHVLGAAEFEHPPAGVAVAAPHRVHHAADWQPVRAQPVRVDVHLILAHVSADRRDVRDAADALEVIAEVPACRSGRTERSIQGRWRQGRARSSPPAAAGPAPATGIRPSSTAPSRCRCRPRR